MKRKLLYVAGALKMPLSSDENRNAKSEGNAQLDASWDFSVAIAEISRM